MSSERRDDRSLDETVDARVDKDVGRLSRLEFPSANERYTLGKLLGKGGMGEVIQATDAQIGRDVAIKRMRQVTESSTARFVREARIQGRLEHPAIVPVHELSLDEEGRPFFVMKRLTGTTLQHILETGEASHHTRRSLLRAFVDVCLAVEFAHTRGVIHRDLKPSNIMLGDFGEVYVLDWGVARVVGEELPEEAQTGESSPGKTEAGAILGTVGYIPPEQLRAEIVDVRADVYALGCILYEILAGATLHKIGQLTAAFEDYDARPSLRAPDRDVAPELDALCVATTQMEPEDRLASARLLGESVQRYLDGDRDTSLRQRLAAEQLDLARAALVTNPSNSTDTPSPIRPTIGDDRRRIAMQHASRALALDPNAAEAADLAGRLILEPPRETPVEVEAELEAMDVVNLRDQARVAIIAFLIATAFVPILMWIGIRDTTHLVLFVGAALVNVATATVLLRSKRRVSRKMLYLVVAAGFAFVLMTSRVFTPFLVAPGIAAGIVLSFCLHPRFGRWWVISLLLVGGALGPWMLEYAGILERTMSIRGGALALHPENSELQMPAAEIGLALFTLTLVLIVGAIARTTASTLREARRIAHMQAWHLRQLVPVV
jgi:serine/threonine protein kinase